MRERLRDAVRRAGVGGRRHGSALGDVGVAGLVTGLAFALNQLPWAARFLPQISVTLALVTAAVAGSAVIAAIAVTWLCADPRTAWLGAGMLFYAVVAIPTTAIGSAVAPFAASIGLARLTAHALVVVLLLVGCRPPRRLREVRVLGLFGVGFLITVCAAALAAMSPGWALSFSASAPVRYVVVAGWFTAGVTLTVQGRSTSAAAGRAWSSPCVRIGVGVAVMALAHFYRVLSEPAQPLAAAGLVFSLIRLVGVFLVCVGLVAWALDALDQATENLKRHEGQLLDATTGLDRIAERDQELRNRLNGLAEAVRDSHTRIHEEPQLPVRVQTELDQLSNLLDHRPDGSQSEIAAADDG
jgi:hypothetical protein